MVFILFANPLLFKECWANDPNKDSPCIIIKCFLCFLYYIILEEFRGFHPAHSGLWKKKVLSLQMAGTNDGMIGIRAHSVLLSIRFHLWLAPGCEIIKCLCHLNSCTFVMKQSNPGLWLNKDLKMPSLVQDWENTDLSQFSTFLFLFTISFSCCF